MPGELGPACTNLGFPRLYAAASLKPINAVTGADRYRWFSAALCRGLIEAGLSSGTLYNVEVVFRGFMPRPH